jgi:hypothetical protein
VPQEGAPHIQAEKYTEIAATTNCELRSGNPSIGVNIYSMASLYNLSHYNFMARSPPTTDVPQFGNAPSLEVKPLH